MRIAICDDNEMIAREMNVLIQKFNREKELDNDIVFFSKPSKLYEYMECHPVDILFMDLEFKDKEKMVQRDFNYIDSLRATV